MRVVSLVPAATEILYALGHEPVAASHECDFPPAVESVPTATVSRVDSTSTTEINEQVRRATTEHGGVYRIDPGIIRDADPDLVITQGVCEVCAIDHSRVEHVIEQLGLDTGLLTTHSHTVSGVFADIERIGRAIDKPDHSATLLASLRERVTIVADRVPRQPQPRVAVFDWTDPVMIAGHWIPELVTTAGGSYGLANPGDVSRPREWTEVVSYDPETIIVAPCGFPIEQTVDQLDTLTERDGWHALSAVQADEVVVMDGNHYVNRPGPRIVDTLEAFAAHFHADTVTSPSTTTHAVPDRRPV